MVEDIFPLYRQRGILIDTNILLLHFVGTVNRERISRFNRTEKFIPEDYDLLQRILTYFQTIVTTPNILTEVNSLANQLGEPERSQCFSIFSEIISNMNESYIESRTITNTENFAKFGLTDCGILNVARGKYLVLTDDLKLANYLQKVGIDAINFNNIRTLGWN